MAVMYKTGYKTATQVFVSTIPINGPSKSNKTNTIQSLTFVLQNIRSLKSVQIDSSNSRENKLSCFKDIVFANHFDVIALTETWLHSSVADHEIIPNGYQIIRRDHRRPNSLCSFM